MISGHDNLTPYPQTLGLTYQSGADTTVRGQFISNGHLPNTKDTSFRAVSDNWPVFALAHELGTISSATAPVLYSIGHVRDPAIQYIVAGGAFQLRSAYFWSAYSNVADMVSDVPNNLPMAH